MTEENGTAIGPAARELLIDRQLPRFEARTFSALLVDPGTTRVGSGRPYAECAAREHATATCMARRLP
jgi:hypothetical protein